MHEWQFKHAKCNNTVSPHTNEIICQHEHPAVSHCRPLASAVNSLLPWQRKVSPVTEVKPSPPHGTFKLLQRGCVPKHPIPVVAEEGICGVDVTQKDQLECVVHLVGRVWVGEREEGGGGCVEGVEGEGSRGWNGVEVVEGVGGGGGHRRQNEGVMVHPCYVGRRII